MFESYRIVRTIIDGAEESGPKTLIGKFMESNENDMSAAFPMIHDFHAPPAAFRAVCVYTPAAMIEAMIRVLGVRDSTRQDCTVSYEIKARSPFAVHRRGECVSLQCADDECEAWKILGTMCGRDGEDLPFLIMTDSKQQHMVAKVTALLEDRTVRLAVHSTIEHGTEIHKVLVIAMPRGVHTPLEIYDTNALSFLSGCCAVYLGSKGEHMVWAARRVREADIHKRIAQVFSDAHVRSEQVMENWQDVASVLNSHPMGKLKSRMAIANELRRLVSVDASETEFEACVSYLYDHATNTLFNYVTAGKTGKTAACMFTWASCLVLEASPYSALRVISRVAHGEDDTFPVNFDTLCIPSTMIAVLPSQRWMVPTHAEEPASRQIVPPRMYDSEEE